MDFFQLSQNRKKMSLHNFVLFHSLSELCEGVIGIATCQVINWYEWPKIEEKKLNKIIVPMFTS